MGTLRIIAGELRGRRIRVPAFEGVRPTPDRVREALFDILGHDLTGVRVLDAFAGTGALGFEAMSRGASEVTFVEVDRRVSDAIGSTARSLGLERRCRVIAGRAEDVLARGAAPGPFDLVVADPPYAMPVREAFLAALVARPRTLAPAATIVVERESRLSAARPGSGGMSLFRTARYGRTCLDFYALGDHDRVRRSAQA